MTSDSPFSPERRRLGHCGPTDDDLLLLRAALLSDGRGVEAWRRWRDRRAPWHADWSAQLLVPLVAHRLGDALADGDLEFAHRQRRRIWIDNQRDLAALRDVLDVLGDAVVEPIVIKGGALVDRAYPPGLRAMGDIDLVVGTESYGRTIDLMLAAGWSAVDRLADRDVSRAVGLESPNGRSIDVHRWVVFPRCVRRDTPGPRDRAVPAGGGLGGARVLAAADAILLAVLHGLEPHDATTLRWPIDVDAIARADGTGDDLWRRVGESATELGVGKLVGLGLDWCRVDLDLDVPQELCDELRRAPYDRVLDAEWRIKRRGVPVLSKVRHYVDGSRAVGTRPTPAGYARIRWAQFRESGGARPFIEQRWKRARATSGALLRR